MKIAVIGAGIAGLAAAWRLRHQHDLIIFESAPHIGGMAHTVELPGHPAIDTGFTVFNRHTSPNLLALLEYFEIPITPCDLSFTLFNQDTKTYISGQHLLAAPHQIFSKKHWVLQHGIKKFRHHVAHLTPDPKLTLESYAKAYRFSPQFLTEYLLPMAAVVWRGCPEGMRYFPARRFFELLKAQRFFLSLDEETSPWFAIGSGARLYIDALGNELQNLIRTNVDITDVIRHRDCVEVVRRGGHSEQYDHVILATHCAHTKSILARCSKEEEIALTGLTYAPQSLDVHQSRELMPPRPKSWETFNFVRTSGHPNGVLTRWMNHLPSFADRGQDYFVTLGASTPPADVLYHTSVPCPSYTRQITSAWDALPHVQGQNRAWFCGAWCGDGFHEDALSAGLAVADALGGESRPWTVTETSPAAKRCKPL